MMNQKIITTKPLNQNKMKQTAVECLIEQLTAIGQLEVPKGSNAVTSIIEQAKQMEKEQIENSYLDGFVERQFSIECKPEQYYNETFKSE